MFFKNQLVVFARLAGRNDRKSLRDPSGRMLLVIKLLVDRRSLVQ